MKLKNKQTGEIKAVNKGVALIHYSDGTTVGYNSLAELNEEWEDYEEAKEDGLDHIITLVVAYSNYDSERYPKEIVEKLKAWKRLKDTGCKPIMWRWKQDYPNDACYVEVVLKCQFDSGVHDRELDLLFGGEE